ncbi:MFS transporter [Paenibacillus nasutitermitis]|uniref:MFS transporter n=1 Tax=Paenibacillus nasutitermitis TaxID=1652958 RepID=A0A917DL85_9BACL|nr:MFS transporter [Paenibacillus nasutitermitis]GGD46760.1 MFS transporter [Paenibacillus nasutitermitis]
MSTSTAAHAPGGKLLSNRFFQTVLLSNILLQIGIWVRNFAVLLYVTDKTGDDPIAVSLISVAEFAPIFIFSFIGGTFADRWRPKRTMIWCDFMSAASVFIVLLTIMFETWEAVYFATFVSAIMSQFSQPSVMKLFKQHIHPQQLQNAMAIFQTLIAIFMIIGPTLGVIVYQNFDINISIGVMGVAFVLSALVLFRLPADIKSKSETAGTGKVMHEMAEGFRYVWRSPVLRTLCAVFALAGLSIGVAQTLGLFVVTERLGQPKEFLQFILMVNGCAMLVGGASVVWIAKRVSPQKLLALGMIVGALCTAAIGLSTNVTLTLVLQFVNGLFFPIIQVAISTMMLQWSAESHVGRVNGVLSPMFVGMMVIMMASAGPIKTVLPLVSIYAGAGVVMFIGVLVLIPIFKHKAPEHASNQQAAPEMGLH